MTRVKICGITNIYDAQHCAKCGADFLGFVFYKKSSRYIEPLKAQEIISKLPSGLSKVGVFVNEEVEVVKRIACDCKLDLLQFHGDESPDYLNNFTTFRTIKALRIGKDFQTKTLSSFAPELFLFDTFKQGVFGGTGEAFDWGLLEGIKTPLIVSGGLNPDNVLSLIEKIKPFAVDASSGVEESAGKKDHNLVKSFIKIVKGK